jgi:hypothetical protein
MFFVLGLHLVTSSIPHLAKRCHHIAPIHHISSLPQDLLGFCAAQRVA